MSDLLDRPGESDPAPWLTWWWRLRALDRRRLIALAAALVVFVVTVETVREAQATVDRLGPRVDVVVVTAERPAGSPLGGSLAVVAWPVGLVPAGAVGGLEAVPPDAVALVDLGPGEVLRADRLGGPGRFGLRADERAVTLPMPLAPPPVAVGSRVDVVAVAPVAGFDTELPVVAASLVAADVRVVHLDDDALTIAVAASRAPAVVEAVATGAVEVTIRP